jgi:NAD(P)-dependent dehydrogenase (short-subunit alcohol dehydrogenase family)
MDTARFSLENKVVMIIGGGGDLARAMAARFVEAGANIALADKRADSLEKAAAEITAKGKKCVTVAANITKKDEVVKMVEQVKSELGRIDVLVNCAGASQMVALLDLDEWQWDLVQDVNVKGTFLVSQAVAKIMKEQGSGSIINMSSYQGFLSTDNLGAYCVSKASVNHLTHVMAAEWGKYNIRVNAIAPGWIHSRLADPYLGLPGINEKMLAKTVIGHFGEPDDVALMALYLASDVSSFTTGSVLNMDGGMLLR